MTISVAEFALKVSSLEIASDNACYRPPSWPPPKNWVVSVDTQGNPLSLWGDAYWDFSAWAGRLLKLDFAGGRHGRSSPPLSPENQHVLRLLTTWVIWGPKGLKAWGTLKTVFIYLRRIVALCESQGILASELNRFPRVMEQIPGLFSKASERGTVLMHLARLQQAKSEIGLSLVDEDGVVCIANAIAKANNKDNDVEQTAYIPPRIWTYQVQRLRECLDDFLKHKNKIEECFWHSIYVYYEKLRLLNPQAVDTSAPFPHINLSYRGKIKKAKDKMVDFPSIAKMFGIEELLRKWVTSAEKESYSVKTLSAYLSLVQFAGLAYIANFTLQRKEEVAELRADCLQWEEDSILGRFAIICGETTKTAPDSDARWPTSPSVDIAITAITGVAKMRTQCASHNPRFGCTDYDKVCPYLMSNSFEPWNGIKSTSYSVRANTRPYLAVIGQYPLLFDEKELTITEEDLVIARMFTPNLNKRGKFKIGNVWPFSYHQLRRTGAVNMFASGLLSDSSIQYIMKHLTLLQTRYYGRNHSRIQFNEEYERVTVSARYDVLAKNIGSLVDDRYASPLGADRKQEIINLLSVKDFKALVKAGRKGEVSFRETRLGGCTKRGHCDYGGIESIARCAGGDGDKPCSDALFDKSKQSSVERQLKAVEERLTNAQPNSPRQKALQAEAQGIRNYLNVVNS
ncbi:hypothetical protein [Burkholderia ubonensis]|uniref:hypothetical protein n=1 Tax=Burkholderia ubonensis TaxID=101571 RepID=UPI000A4A317A|nr:hypothetical protein [Burkholderia ubonensis]